MTKFHGENREGTGGERLKKSNETYEKNHPENVLDSIFFDITCNTGHFCENNYLLLFPFQKNRIPF